MDLHPIFVHFPIALLTVYAVFECISFGKLRTNHTWRMVKAALVLTGLVSSFAALQTGEIAEHLVGRSDLVKMHSTFAVASVWIFAVPALAYLLFLLDTLPIFSKMREKTANSIQPIAKKLMNFIFFPPLIIVLALAGLAAITVTGALGGALVYGPDADPVVKFIYDLLF